MKGQEGKVRSPSKTRQEKDESQSKARVERTKLFKDKEGGVVTAGKGANCK